MRAFFTALRQGKTADIDRPRRCTFYARMPAYAAVRARTDSVSHRSRRISGIIWSSMRVLQLGPYPPPHGGVQTNLVAIRSFLRKQSIPCAVINITRHRKAAADEVYYPKTAAQLLELLARLRYDIIHLHLGGMLTKRLLALSLVCALRPGAKSVMTFHSGGYPSTPEGQSRGLASFAGFAFRRFDGLIGVNEEIMAFFRKVGVSPQRTRLISPYAFVPDQQSFRVASRTAGGILRCAQSGSDFRWVAGARV